MALLRRIRGLRRASPRARRDLLRAELALIRARWTIRFRKRGSLLTTGGAPHEPANRDAPSIARANELALAVRRAADHGPVPASCLARALATCRLLEKEGLEGSAVRVGVRMHDGQLEAHAWVEYGGVKLIESESEVAHLSEVDELKVRLGA